MQSDSIQHYTDVELNIRPYCLQFSIHSEAGDSSADVAETLDQFVVQADFQATRATEEGDEDTHGLYKGSEPAFMCEGSHPLKTPVPAGAADMTSSCKGVNLESQQFQMSDQAWEAIPDE